MDFGEYIESNNQHDYDIKSGGYHFPPFPNLFLNYNQYYSYRKMWNEFVHLLKESSYYEDGKIYSFHEIRDHFHTILFMRAECLRFGVTKRMINEAQGNIKRNNDIKILQEKVE